MNAANTAIIVVLHVKDDELTLVIVLQRYGDCWYDNVLIMDDLVISLMM